MGLKTGGLMWQKFDDDNDVKREGTTDSIKDRKGRRCRRKLREPPRRPGIGALSHPPRLTFGLFGLSALFTTHKDSNPSGLRIQQSV